MGLGYEAYDVEKSASLDEVNQLGYLLLVGTPYVRFDDVSTNLIPPSTSVRDLGGHLGVFIDSDLLMRSLEHATLCFGNSIISVAPLHPTYFRCLSGRSLLVGSIIAMPHLLESRRTSFVGSSQ